MTTDQIRATTPLIADHASADELLANAEGHAREIVAKARYEAFRMVTEARTEAEAILSEAKPAHNLSGEPEPVAFDDTEETDAATDAVEQAGAIVERAHAEAEAIVAAAIERVGSEHAELIAETERLEAKVTHTKAVLAALEDRLAAIATTTGIAPVAGQGTAAQPETTDQPELLTPTYQTIHSPGRKAAWSRPIADGPTEERSDSSKIDDTAAQIPPAVDDAPAGPRTILDYSPSVASPKSDESLESGPKATEEQGSFYTRRSAKLPRIGDSAGHDALGAMRAVRMPVEQ